MPKAGEGDKGVMSWEGSFAAALCDQERITVGTRSHEQRGCELGLWRKKNRRSCRPATRTHLPHSPGQVTPRAVRCYHHHARQRCA